MLGSPQMEPQQPAKAMIVGSRVLPKPKAPKIASTTFEAEGVQLPPQLLKDLKAIAAERDKQRKRVMGDEEWHSLLDHAQYFFRASSILVGLAHPLHHILAEHHVPAPSETILVKVLAAGQKKSMEARNPAASGLRNAATPTTSAMQVRCLQVGATPLKWVVSKRAS